MLLCVDAEPAAASRGRLRGSALLGAVAALMTADLAMTNGPNESTALPPEQLDVLRAGSSDPVIAFLKERLTQNAAPDRRDRVELPAIDFHWPNATLDYDLGYNRVRLKILEDAAGAGSPDAVSFESRRKCQEPIWRGLRCAVVTELRKQLPFALFGLDTDNDIAFMNETLKTDCEQVNNEAFC